MLKDKTYIQSRDMLFNVTGYQHPVDHVYASLKYVDGTKWTRGYAAACEYLRERHADFVGQFIRIPCAAIEKTFDPHKRWSDLLEAERKGEYLSPLHAESLTLARRLSETLKVSLEEFGITDSLLWGTGKDTSDIDLVVYGIHNADRTLSCAGDLYKASDFSRPDPDVMTAPYASQVADWADLLSRKVHMGAFRGRLFSLRCVLTDEEVLHRTADSPAEEPGSSAWTQTLEFEVDDVSESLCFPAIYRDQMGNRLVDYSVVYEGVFRPGDVVRCNCVRESAAVLKGESNRGETDRFVISGPCEIVKERA